MDEFRILAPTAILGYGFPEESFQAGMKRNPHLIAVDAGSTDPGPYYLGKGVSFTARRAVKRDLTIMLKAAVPRGIPVVIGTAGGSGGDPHVNWNLEIIREIAAEEGLNFRLAVIGAEIDKETVLDYRRRGKITALTPGPELTVEDIEKATRIVGQMGTEPLIQALDLGAQVILAGRCYDPAVFAAPAIREGFAPGLAIHLGKILECAAIAAVPGSGSDCLFGYLHREDFEVETLHPARKCTVASVAAHTLYEKSNPYLLPGPGGILDLKNTRFEQVGENRVRVYGSDYSETSPYRIKLEGAKKEGYRAVAVAGTRDPVMISRIEEIIAGVKEKTADNFPQTAYYLHFHIYGKNGVMGKLEPIKKPASHELGIIMEVVAATEELAMAICAFTRSTMLHFGYEGRLSTAGNLAFPFSPAEFAAGEVYQFSVYHLMEVADPQEFFPVRLLTVTGERKGTER